MLSTFILVEQKHEIHRDWGQRRRFLEKMRSPVPLKNSVPPGGTTLAYKFLRMSTFHVVCSGNKYRGFKRLKAWLEQHFRVAEAFDAKKKYRLVEQPP